MQITRNPEMRTFQPPSNCLSERYNAIVPGRLEVVTAPPKWGAVKSVKGVKGVKGNCHSAIERRDRRSRS